MTSETSRALLSSLLAATAKQMHSALKQVIKRSILVLDAMGDIDAKFRTSGIWNRAIDDAWFAYGQNTARVRLVPTSREIAHSIRSVAAIVQPLPLEHPAHAVDSAFTVLLDRRCPLDNDRALGHEI